MTLKPFTTTSGEMQQGAINEPTMQTQDKHLCKQTRIIIGMGIAILLGAAFIAWLMWSSKGQKESFLSFAWIAMLAAVVLQVAFALIT